MNLNKCGPWCWLVGTAQGVGFCMVHDYRTDDSFAAWSRRLLSQVKETEAKKPEVAHGAQLPNFAL